MRQDERDEILRNIETIFLQKSRGPFPPSQNWISESAENAARWRAHLATVRRHDDRRARYPVMTIPPADQRWKRVVRANEDIIVRDKDTGEIVLLVMRNFCGDKDVLEWANSLVEVGVSTKKSIRLDDPGHLVLAGWSSGSRIRPCLMWAKNLLASAVQEMDTPEKVHEYDFDCSSAYALLWNMIRKRLPEEILVDLKTFVEKSGDVAKFTMNARGSSVHWGMTLPTGSNDANRHDTAYFQFSETELPPPQGIMASNYCRFCHHEENAHKWCVAWNTYRNPDAKHGSNFFVADYAIRVENSENMLFAWKGDNYHGTTLPDVAPQDLEQADVQSGLGFAMSKQLGELLRGHYSGEKAMPVDFNGNPEWFVEKVLDSKMEGRQLIYKIKWRGDPEPTWEPAEDVNELAAIDIFHDAYPGKPGPLPENA
jgi:hypothetical protein